MMFGSLALPALLAAAIPLSGVVGDRLRARAFFDANNVRTGDPLTLTVDFLGEADFTSLHPPALAKAVDARDWRVYDDSARTDTFNDARRLTYRVRPLRAGVLWFPPLSFTFRDRVGMEHTVCANAIPVHARPGEDVAVAGLGEDVVSMPEPDALIADPGVPLTEDESFAWRKACATLSPDAFAAFGFPAAKLNEARLATLAGDWKRALSVYERLEWRVGQTPAIERGLRAALARRFDNPLAELPVWRQVGRPVLRYAWAGRVGIVLGSALALLVLWLLVRRLIRAFAAVAAVLLFVRPAAGNPFAMMEEMQRRMEQQMQQMQSVSFSFGGGASEAMSEPVLEARVTSDNAAPCVGETFNLVVGIESARTSEIGSIRLTPSETFGLRACGASKALPDVPAANPSNVIRRLAVPVRYDVPFRGELGFAVEGMVSSRQGRGNSFFSFSRSFRLAAAPLALEVRPLDAAGQPADFGGVVADHVDFRVASDLRRVGTNDIVTLTYRLSHDGYVPQDWMPPGASFEWGRLRTRDGEQVEWRGYFVADGASATPESEVVYYVPGEKAYRRAKAGRCPLRYQP